MTATPRMRFGLMLPSDFELRRVADFAVQAEEQKWDLLACGEHVFFHGPSSNALVTLAAAAGATRRIRILSALTVLPVYPIALAAKMIATLDGVSQGRFELGVGVGGEYPAEFEACGVPVTERGRRTDEALELLQQLFAGEEVTFSGDFTTIEGQRLSPLPVQRPRPPIWVGGRSRGAMRRAGRHADVWLPYLVTPQQLETSLVAVRESAAGTGRDPETVRGAVFCWSGLGTDGARAKQLAIEAVSSLYQQDFAPMADRYLLTGTPGAVIDRLTEYQMAGAETVIFAPACPPDVLDTMVDTFVAEVAPALSAIDDGGMSLPCPR